MSNKSFSTDTSTEPKLVWNGPIDAEETFETKMSELKTKLIKESIYHCVSEKDSTNRIAGRPPLSQLTTPSYATHFAAWKKSISDLNDDVNEAIRTLLSLFHPDCYVHDELIRWFEEDVSATLSLLMTRSELTSSSIMHGLSSTLYTSLTSRLILIPF